MMIEERVMSGHEPHEPRSPLAAADLPIIDVLTGPWIVQKIRALAELNSAAGRMLDESLDHGLLPQEISNHLERRFGLKLSELEVSRYGVWLPYLRQHALLKAQQRAERLVTEATAVKERERA